MKPAAFEYFAPTSLEAALDLLERHGGEAKVLAGGQSLVPAMNFRLATPAALVDVNRIPGLDRPSVERDELVIPMLARHAAFERPVVGDPLGPLLAETSHLVGHLPIRVRGTFAGSLAHADPAAEWCMLTLALDAVMVARSRAGERRIPAAEFFEGPFTTSLAEDEILTEVRLPLLRQAGTGVCEKSRTAGDFATVAVVAALWIEEGKIARAAVGIGGAESRPVRPVEAEATLAGAPLEPSALDAAAQVAAEAVDPISDHSCSADYRRHLVEVLVRRALDRASRRAG